MAQVTGPDPVGGITTAQQHTDGDLGLLHDPLAIFFAVGGVTPTLDRHMDIVQVQVNAGLVQIGNAGVAHGGQYAAEVRVTGKKSGLDQRRMRNRISHQLALGHGFAALDRNGDELGSTLTITHNGLGQLLRNAQHGGLEGLPLGAGQRIDGGV